MPEILICFGLHLRNYNVDSRYSYEGPLFHKWLPDARNDAIKLDTGDHKIALEVWFERRGFSNKEHGLIEFDLNRKEVDPNAMARQAVLVGGPLFGELKLEVDETIIQALAKEGLGDPDYEKFGKHIVKTLYPPVSKFIELLRALYGQYWIKTLAPWDSRSSSLGAYCSAWNMRWSNDNGISWHEFRPNEASLKSIALLARSSDYDRLIKDKDWAQLPAILGQIEVPSAAADILVQSFQYLDEGNIRQALIEGVIALETAISAFAQRKLNKNNDLLNKFQSFYQLPLPAQLIVVSAFSDSCSLEQLSSSLEAIALRNRIVHEGEKPPRDSEHLVRNLLETIASLLPEPKMRFPFCHSGNSMEPAPK